MIFLFQYDPEMKWRTIHSCKISEAIKISVHIKYNVLNGLGTQTFGNFDNFSH